MKLIRLKKISILFIFIQDTKTFMYMPSKDKKNCSLSIKLEVFFVYNYLKQKVYKMIFNTQVAYLLESSTIFLIWSASLNFYIKKYSILNMVFLNFIYYYLFK